MKKIVLISIFMFIFFGCNQEHYDPITLNNEQTILQYLKNMEISYSINKVNSSIVIQNPYSSLAVFRGYLYLSDNASSFDDFIASNRNIEVELLPNEKKIITIIVNSHINANKLNLYSLFIPKEEYDKNYSLLESVVLDILYNPHSYNKENIIQLFNSIKPYIKRIVYSINYNNQIN